MGGKAPGTNATALSKIHLTLFRSDAAIVSEYKLTHSDVQYQSGTRVLATDHDWDIFKNWLMETHRRLYAKPHGLARHRATTLRYLRNTKFSTAVV
eukprot:SAG31_NODE_4090_length_3600_cov_4.861183_1_plen_96_part_00